MLLAFVGLPAGCGLVGPPSCHDETVLDLVRQIVTEQSAPALLPLAAKDLGDDWAKGIPIVMAYDFARLQSEAAANPAAQRLVEAIRRQFAHVEVTLENVHAKRVDEDVGRVWCGTQITMKLHGMMTASLAMTYTAQYTEDSHVYVEVHQ